MQFFGLYPCGVLLISKSKLVLRCKQSDIVPIFATGIKDTSGSSGKFTAGVIDTSGKFATGVVKMACKFSAGVLDTGDAPSSLIYP